MRDIIGPSSAKNTVRTHRTPHGRNSTPSVSGKYGPGRRPSDAGTKNPPEPKLRGMHTSVRQDGSLGRLHVSIVLFERIEALLDLRPRDRQQELIGPEFTVLQYLDVIVLSPAGLVLRDDHLLQRERFGPLGDLPPAHVEETVVLEGQFHAPLVVDARPNP